MVDLNALDEQCGGSQGGDDVPSRERMEDALNVHIDSKEETRAAGSSGPPPALLSSQLRRYKEACPDVAQQHIWKLIAALFVPRGGTEGHTDPNAMSFANDEGAGASAQEERLREAIRAWLRVVLWDSVSAYGTPPVDEGTESRLWAIVGAVHPQAAVHSALADGSRAYLAAMLAQPLACMRTDLAGQLQAQRWGGEAAALIPHKLQRLLSHGVDPPLPTNALGASQDMAWLLPYALALHGGKGGAEGVTVNEGERGLLVPPSSNGTPPVDVAWHLLRLHTRSSEQLKPLPTSSTTPTAAGWWLRWGDYSFAFHLSIVASSLLGIPSPAATTREAFFHQLEASWRAFLDAHQSGAPFDPQRIAQRLERCPLPDAPSPEVLGLLEVASTPAALPPSAQALPAAHLAVAHATAGASARIAGHPLLALRHYLAALRLTQQSRAAYPMNDPTNDPTATAAPPPSAAARAAGPAVPLADASRIWAQAHDLLAEILPTAILHSGGLCEELQRHRADVASAAAEFDTKGAWSQSVAAACDADAGGAVGGQAALAEVVRQAKLEEKREGRWSAHTLDRLAALHKLGVV